MYASDLIARARSLADLENSDAITYQDEINSLNEKYHDVINELYKADDDYFYKEVVLSNWQQYQDVNNAYNYLIPLPSDFYKLRTVDYQETTYWRPIRRATMNQRDQVANEVMYRLQNNNLWIIAGSTTWQPALIKMGYYPVPQSLSAPRTPTLYNIAQIPSTDAVTCATYLPALYNGLNPLYYEQMVYVMNQTNLYVEVPQLNIKVRIGAPPNLSTSCYIVYRNGYLIALSSNNLYTAPYNPAATPQLYSGTVPPADITWTLITSGLNPGDWQNLTLTPYSSSLSNAGDLYATSYDAGVYTVWRVIITGAGIIGASQVEYTQPNTPVANYSYTTDLAKGWRAFIDNTTSLIMVDTTPTIPGASPYVPTLTSLGVTAAALYSPNGTDMYYRDSFGSVHHIILDTVSTTPTIATNTVVVTEVSSIYGPIAADNTAAIVLNTGRLYETSVADNTAMTYPSNVLYEALAYQMAVDFKRKYDANNVDLNARRDEIWNNFLHSIIRRDEYSPERIQNKRPILNANGFGFFNF